MQIEINRDDLLRPMAVVTGVVERRQTLPILSYVLVKGDDSGLSVTATDLEVEVVARMAAETHGHVSLTLPARKLFDICRAVAPGTSLVISRNGEKVTVKAGKSRFSLLSLPSDDFPAVDAGGLEQVLAIDQLRLKGLLDRTAFCMAQQDVRYYLNGLFIEIEGKRLRAVATDGHRMALSDETLETTARTNKQIIVPRKGVQELTRLLSDGPDATVKVGANHLRVEVGDIVFTSKLIDGKFPDYTKVIPSPKGRSAMISREVFRNALARVSILANEKYRGVRLGLQTDRLSISAHNPEQEEAAEDVEIKYSGEPLEIGFNVSYLSEAVSSLTGSEVLISVDDPNSSCVLSESGNESTQYIIMPMRL